MEIDSRCLASPTIAIHINIYIYIHSIYIA